MRLLSALHISLFMKHSVGLVSPPLNTPRPNMRRINKGHKYGTSVCSDGSEPAGVLRWETLILFHLCLVHVHGSPPSKGPCYNTPRSQVAPPCFVFLSFLVEVTNALQCRQRKEKKNLTTPESQEVSARAQAYCGSVSQNGHFLKEEIELGIGLALL